MLLRLGDFSPWQPMKSSMILTWPCSSPMDSVRFMEPMEPSTNARGEDRVMVFIGFLLGNFMSIAIEICFFTVTFLCGLSIDLGEMALRTVGERL